MSTTPATPTPPTREPAESWQVWIREWLTALGSILGGVGMIVAIVALIVSQRSLDVSQRTHTGSVVSTLYQLGQDSNKFFGEHPEIRVYFYADERPGVTDEQLMDRYNKEDPKTRSLVQAGAEILADYADVAWVQREFLPPDDWDSWWNYFCDAYDESPVLRAMYERRKTWYQTYGPLSDKPNRARYYRGTKRDK